VTFKERAARTPCPRHGRQCWLSGTRGRLFTFRCGFVFHADEERVRVLMPRLWTTNYEED